MTWRPSPQPPCEPGCTCDLNPVPEPAPAIEAPEPRTCTPEDPCSFCGPVERFWDSDPAPVEAPPEPVTQQSIRSFMEEFAPDPAAEERTRQLIADNLGVDVKRVESWLVPRPDGPAQIGYRILSEPEAPKRLSFIDRIRNARKDRT